MSGRKSNPDFDSFNPDQMRQIDKWYSGGRMTVRQLASHWGVPVETIKAIVDYRAARRVTSDAH